MEMQMDRILTIVVGFFIGIFGYLIKDKLGKVEKVENRVGQKIDQIFEKISNIEKKVVEINSLRDTVVRLEARIESIDKRVNRIEKDYT